MKEGDVILTSIPQADGNVKNRPAILLREMPSYGDLLVCGVSTQLHHYVQGFDEIIRPTDADFASSGLVAASLRLYDHEVGVDMEPEYVGGQR